MSISIQQFLLSEGSKNSRLLKKSILLSRRSDEREKVINEKLNKINENNVKFEIFTFPSLCVNCVTNL